MSEGPLSRPVLISLGLPWISGGEGGGGEGRSLDFFDQQFHQWAAGRVLLRGGTGRRLEGRCKRKTRVCLPPVLPPATSPPWPHLLALQTHSGCSFGWVTTTPHPRPAPGSKNSISSFCLSSLGALVASAKLFHQYLLAFQLSHYLCNHFLPLGSYIHCSFYLECFAPPHPPTSTWLFARMSPSQ